MGLDAAGGRATVRFHAGARRCTLKAVPGVQFLEVEMLQRRILVRLFSFTSNEVYVVFSEGRHRLTLASLQTVLEEAPAIGAPDCADAGMLQ